MLKNLWRADCRGFLAVVEQIRRTGGLGSCKVHELSASPADGARKSHSKARRWIFTASDRLPAASSASIDGREHFGGQTVPGQRQMAWMTRICASRSSIRSVSRMDEWPSRRAARHRDSDKQSLWDVTTMDECQCGRGQSAAGFLSATAPITLRVTGSSATLGM